MGRGKSSLVREQCFERLEVERAICCLETRKEIREGERQSPETADLAKCLREDGKKLRSLGLCPKLWVGGSPKL